VDEPEDVPLKANMKAPRTKARRKRDDEDDSDRRLVPLHRFHDIGVAIESADFRPRSKCADPEQIMAAAFIRIGFDYGGRLHAEDMLHAVLSAEPAAKPRPSPRRRPLMVAAAE
jgi:hypothetical protein